MNPQLTIDALIKEAGVFTEIESKHNEAIIYGTTDGKAVGTYIEQKFRRYLLEKYKFKAGNSAKGVDFPELNLDLKVTSIKQPQSSSPFKSGRQKIFGLGYSLILFVYDKKDDSATKTANLNFLHTVYIHENRTADYQITRALRQILENDGNRDDLYAYFEDKRLPIDDTELDKIVDDLLKKPPEQGYLTISNALQWRLQYGRAIQVAGSVEGIEKLR